MQRFGLCIRFAKKDQTVASRFKTNPGSLNQVSIIPLLVFFIIVYLQPLAEFTSFSL
jgi:hypothetical protein